MSTEPTRATGQGYNGPLVNPQDHIEGTFNVTYRHRVMFERQALLEGTALADVLAPRSGGTAETLVVLDQGLVDQTPTLPALVESWFTRHSTIATLAAAPLVMPGSEDAKQGLSPVVDPVIEAIANAGLCRHSRVLAIGGGAMLDAVGLASSLAHRGIGLVRMPTTTLAQGDAGIGVKNGVNSPHRSGGKNLMGTFAVPLGVINDSTFLLTLDDTHWRGGLAESIKVALVKDSALLDTVETHAQALTNRDLDCMERVLMETAKLHLRHITDGGDPFEMELARPLDFGHWAAHELETQSNWAISHGEAVAAGMLIDLRVGEAMSLTAVGTADRIETLLRQLGFLQRPHTAAQSNNLLVGLEHFRQHLGGKLTLCMIQEPGVSIDVHEVDMKVAEAAIDTVLGGLPH